jgi:hypothetical protein
VEEAKARGIRGERGGRVLAEEAETGARVAKIGLPWHVTSANLRTSSLNAIYEEKIFEVKGIKVITAGCGGTKGTHVQEQGCGALANLSRINTHTHTHTHTIGEADGIEVIIAGMWGHEGDALVQEQGCGALASLDAACKSNKVKIGRGRECFFKGGVEMSSNIGSEYPDVTRSPEVHSS